MPLINIVCPGNEWAAVARYALSQEKERPCVIPYYITEISLGGGGAGESWLHSPFNSHLILPRAKFKANLEASPQTETLEEFQVRRVSKKTSKIWEWGFMYPYVKRCMGASKFGAMPCPSLPSTIGSI